MVWSSMNVVSRSRPHNRVSLLYARQASSAVTPILTVSRLVIGRGYCDAKEGNMRQEELFGDDEIPSQPDDASFPERVYRIVRRIPPGKVTTYGTIAAVLGDRRGARMVGWAMHNCPEDVSACAHRVVNRYGGLSGGWAWGHPDIMRQLLLDEGVIFVDDYQVDLNRHLWIPPLDSELDDEDR
jgi:methylated-DNA-protein-cysteine methyltransferase related protein